MAAPYPSGGGGGRGGSVPWDFLPGFVVKARLDPGEQSPAPQAVAPPRGGIRRGFTFTFAPPLGLWPRPKAGSGKNSHSPSAPPPRARLSHPELLHRGSATHRTLGVRFLAPFFGTPTQHSYRSPLLPPSPEHLHPQVLPHSWAEKSLSGSVPTSRVLNPLPTSRSPRSRGPRRRSSPLPLLIPKSPGPADAPSAPPAQPAGAAQGKVP